MKIIYGLEIFLPHISGVTNIVEATAAHFAKDHDVFVITSSETGKPKEINSRGGYKIIRTPSFVNPFKRSTKVSYFAPLEMKKIFLRIHPDIVHLHDPAFISFSLAQEAKKYHIPVIFTQHSNLLFPSFFVPDFSKEAVTKFYALYLKAFINNYCDLVITPTKTLKEEIATLQINKNILVLSNGVDLNLFKPQKVSSEFLEKYHLQNFSQYPIVLYIGRLDRDKNVELFYQIVPEVIKKSDANFIFIGRGNLSENFKKFFQAKDFIKRVKIIDSVEPNSSDLVNFYNLATLFVIPSFNETQSLVTMEAMACGLPIIASKAGALPELVRNNQNGFLFDPSDAPSFIKGVLEIINSQSLHEKMSLKSLELVQKHEREHIFKKLFSIYTKIYEK